MKFNLKKKCEESRGKEAYYGARINNQVKDVYLGMGYMDPGESGKKIGPGRRHEEIIYAVDGSIKLSIKKTEDIILNPGELYFLPDGKKARLTNLSEKKTCYMIAGGHTKHHSH
mgnify:CR=1 FL=1